MKNGVNKQLDDKLDVTQQISEMFSVCSPKRNWEHVPKSLPLDLFYMHCNHYLLSQQCSPKHVRTGCDVIKTC